METIIMSVEDRIIMERRVSKAEESLSSLHEDIKDIKRTLQWSLGLIFGLNSTIIGLLAKGFNII